jgi:hypothetical protein
MVRIFPPFGPTKVKILPVESVLAGVPWVAAEFDPQVVITWEMKKNK